MLKVESVFEMGVGETKKEGDSATDAISPPKAEGAYRNDQNSSPEEPKYKE